MCTFVVIFLLHFDACFIWEVNCYAELGFFYTLEQKIWHKEICTGNF